MAGFLIRVVLSWEALVGGQPFPLERFLLAECKVTSSGSVSKAALYEAFQAWSERQGHRARIPRNQFFRRLWGKALGFKERRVSTRDGGRQCYVVGLRLKNAPNPEAEAVA